MYQVNDIYPCIQGEGSMAGTPMTLVRLQGCDIGCPWCDTRDSWPKGGRQMSAEEIAMTVADGPEWVMITGGEPCMQDLGPLTLALSGFREALETSGTYIITGAFDWITVSPKVGMPGKRIINPDAIAVADEIKMPVKDLSDIKNLEMILSYADPSVIVALQPVFMADGATELCYQTCLTKGWRLSLQTHKLIGAR